MTVQFTVNTNLVLHADTGTDNYYIKTCTDGKITDQSLYIYIYVYGTFYIVKLFKREKRSIGSMELYVDRNKQ